MSAAPWDVYAPGEGVGHTSVWLCRPARLWRSPPPITDRIAPTFRPRASWSPPHYGPSTPPPERLAKVKSLPPRFDASRDSVQQHFAISADGTRIPYFLVAPKAMKLDGSTPTLMFGYGGFQVSLTPTYHAELGKLWLERGGAYVLANIRGGGEFGPPGMRRRAARTRQRAFDDFAAVAGT